MIFCIKTYIGFKFGVTHFYFAERFFFLPKTAVDNTPAAETKSSAIQRAILLLSPVWGDFVSVFAGFASTVNVVSAVPSVHTISRVCFPAVSVLRYSGFSVTIVEPSFTV